MRLLPFALLACTTETVDTAPQTSDTPVEIVGTPISECIDDELHLQIGFNVSVPRVEVELTNGSTTEMHDIPYAGKDKETGEIFLYDVEMETGADEANTSKTTFTCADAPYGFWRVYDESDALMACYVGEFVADQFDATGCPEE